jgi:hypothetical protein
MPEKINIQANVQSNFKDANNSSLGEKSLKSLRSYQLGVVYKDKYGRETPVLTNEKALFSIPKKLAPLKNSVTSSVLSDPPSWADSFKFFIKETSNEYYNLCMDRWYDAEDGNIWLSFPSAERNKVQEDTFIILKKEASSSNAVVDEAKYRVIDVKNDAPDFIKTDYEQYGSYDLVAAANGSAVGSNVIKFTWATWALAANPFYDVSLTSGTTPSAATDAGFSGLSETGFVGYKDENIVMRLTANGGQSKWLDVSKISKNVDIFVKLVYSLKADPAEVIYDNNFTGNQTITVGIARKTVKNKSEFNGRFFVKIRRDGTIEDTIRAVNNPSPNISIVSERSYWTVKGDQTCGGSGDNYQNFWDGVGQKFLIDNVRRGSVGTYQTIGSGFGSNVGTDGPYDSHYGYGITGSRTSHMGAYTMDLTLQKCIDYVEDSFSTSANNTDNMNFFHQIKAPGTMFRFKEDPFQHIYKVITSRNTVDEPNLVEAVDGIYNYSTSMSSGNKTRTWASNKAHRIHLRFQTTGWRLEDLNSPGTPMDQAYSAAQVALGNAGAGYIAQDPSFSNKYPIFPAGDFNGSYNAPIAAGMTAVWQPTDKGFGKYVNNNTGLLAPLGNNGAGTGAGSTGTWNDLNQSVTTCATGVNVDPQTTFQVSGWQNTIQIITMDQGDAEVEFSDNPAVWETEPREDVGMDIYYETSQAYPLSLDQTTNELFAPYGCAVSCEDIVKTGPSINKSFYLPPNAQLFDWGPTGHGGDTILLSVKTDEVGYINHNAVLHSTNPVLGNNSANVFQNLNNKYMDLEFKFTRQDGSYTTAKVVYCTGWSPGNHYIDPIGYTGNSTDRVLLKFDRDLSKSKIGLPYFNCYSFGNGVESDRIRDDFNAIRLDKGVKASTVLDEPYEEEQRANGLIYSGIYNSMSGVNNLNQFIAGEKITKDVNPNYGSIQKLKTRDTNLIAFCEDKVLKIVANKDALYNADGQPQLIASNKVLGTTTSFAGEFGISKNPESFASESFRMYFTDKQRGKVLRLSQDGITPISDMGMQDWFADNMQNYYYLIGSFDDRKKEYNLTLDVENSYIPPDNWNPKQPQNKTSTTN